MIRRSSLAFLKNLLLENVPAQSGPVPGPIVLSVTPNHASADGNTELIITGVNLSDLRKVRFAGGVVESTVPWQVMGDRKVMAYSPAGPGGTVFDLEVTTGTGVATLGNAFTLDSSGPPAFDPATLPLTSWLRDFSVVPWAGTASASGSASTSFDTAGVDPAAGTAVNGHAPAAFDGTQYLQSTKRIVDLFGTPSMGSSDSNAGTIIVLFNAATGAAAIASAASYALPGLLSTTGGGDVVVSFAADGVHFSLYNGGYQEKIIPCATDGWHVAQLAWNGTSAFARVDGGPAIDIGVGGTNDDNTLPLGLGTNYAHAALFDGAILEVMTLAEGLTTTQLDDVIGYFNTRYGLSIGPFDPMSVGTPVLWYDAAHATTVGGPAVVLSTLPDQSGNGNDASVPIGAFAPGYTATNAAFNNLPTFDFPDGDQTHVNTPDLGLSTGPVTLVLVCNTNSSISASSYLVSASNAKCEILAANGGVNVAGSNDDGSHDVIGGNLGPGVAGVLVWVADGASSKMYVSAHAPVAADGGAQDLTGRFLKLGTYGAAAGTFWSQAGSTAHFLVYDGALSQSDVAYLLDGFGALAGASIGA